MVLLQIGSVINTTNISTVWGYWIMFLIWMYSLAGPIWPQSSCLQFSFCPEILTHCIVCFNWRSSGCRNFTGTSSDSFLSGIVSPLQNSTLIGSITLWRWPNHSVTVSIIAYFSAFCWCHISFWVCSISTESTSKPPLWVFWGHTKYIRQGRDFFCPHESCRRLSFRGVSCSGDTRQQSQPCKITLKLQNEFQWWELSDCWFVLC